MLRLRLATLTIGWGAYAQIVAAQATEARTITTASDVVSLTSAGQRVAQDTLRQMQIGSVFAPPLLPRPASMLLSRAAPHFVRTSAIAVGASAVISLADGPVMREIAKLRSPDGAGQRASVLFASLGGVVPLSLGTVMWAGGALAGNGAIQNLGVESTQAVLLSGALTIGIKGLIGRARPNASPDDPDQYYPGRGFFNAARASFPSGHTSAAFAMATVLSKELSARYPGKRWLIRSALYSAAGSVGLARMYQNAHWPSDVVTGAALGTLSGLQALSWHGDRH